MQILHIQWCGPYPINTLRSPPPGLEPLDRMDDRGVYQIYGDHPVYGAEVLLYIGKTDRQTFRARIEQHCWDSEETNITCYVGRLSGVGTPSNEDWQKQIDVAEKLLIQAHKPSHNCRDILEPLESSFAEFSVFNWGNRRALLPEASGARWSSTFHNWSGYAAYSHQALASPPAASSAGQTAMPDRRAPRI